MKPVLAVVVVIAALVVVWRVVRGANSWAQVIAFGTALIAGVLAGNAYLEPDVGVPDLVVWCVGMTFSYLGWRRPKAKEAASEDPPSKGALSAEDRKLQRIQGAMLGLTVLLAIVIPVFWVARKLTGTVLLAIGLPAFLIMVGLWYAAYRVVTPSAANPFDRRSEGFVQFLVGFVRSGWRDFAGALPLRAPRPDKPADTRR